MIIEILIFKRCVDIRKQNKILSNVHTMDSYSYYFLLICFDSDPANLI